MDHAYVEEHSLIERYYQGRLPPEEEALFEAHFVDCPQCTEQLELEAGFRRGLKAVAAEEATRLETAARLGLLARLARLAGRQPLTLAAAAALAGVIVTSAWLTGTGRVGPAIEAPGPLANPPVFILSAVRGVEGPSATVDLEAVGGWLTLAVDVDDDPRFDSYRLAVLGAGGEELWSRDGLLPNSLETLMVTFPASFFAPGDYRLEIEGTLPDGSAVEVDGFPFRIVDGQ